MKTLPLLLAGCGLLLAGCESFSGASDNFKAKLAIRDQPHIRTFDGDVRASYEAARTAVDQMDFHFQRGGPAQGELEAISTVGAGESLRQARQIVMTVRFTAGTTPAGGTDVQVWLREIRESDAGTSGATTESPLRDSALYETFFRNLQHNLSPPKQG
ncbi:MAG TPA: hypothetical protein VG838_16765 [Opitutaceae bacterium]|nr:hypothetical protein [Opitutaceae bacterium]